jgi:hypothetical protein
MDINIYKKRGLVILIIDRSEITFGRSEITFGRSEITFGRGLALGTNILVDNLVFKLLILLII